METTIDTNALGEKIVGVIKTIYDPEIPVDIYELGLIYSMLAPILPRPIIPNRIVTLLITRDFACRIREGVPAILTPSHDTATGTQRR